LYITVRREIVRLEARMGFLGDLREWFVWWREEKRKQRTEERTELAEIRAERIDDRSGVRHCLQLFDDQIAELERAIQTSTDEADKRRLKDRQNTVRSRKLLLLEVQTLTHPAFQAALETRQALLGERVGGATIGPFAFPELPPPGEVRAPEIMAADRLLLVGIALGRAEQNLAAEAVFSECLSLRPDDPIALLARGVARHYLGRNEEALADFDSSLGLQPDNAKSLVASAVALINLARFEEAIARSNRSLELEPDARIALNSRAIAFSALGRHAEAFADLNRSLELEPDDPYTLYNRACTCSLSGDYSAALRDLQSAIEREPKYKEDARSDFDFDKLREDPQHGPRLRELLA
jgi:Flp pilus assembly protein TadD